MVQKRFIQFLSKDDLEKKFKAAPVTIQCLVVGFGCAFGVFMFPIWAFSFPSTFLYFVYSGNPIPLMVWGFITGFIFTFIE